MEIMIVAVGTRQPTWVQQGYDEYARRMPPEFPVRLKEVKAEPRDLGKSALANQAAEAVRIRQAIPKGTAMVLLDERGQRLTSRGLGDWLGEQREAVRSLAIVIGGPDGLDETLKSEARGLLRLSDLTLPHGMVRVLLAEQLYRAAMILQGHPYHRD